MDKGRLWTSQIYLPYCVTKQGRAPVLTKQKAKLLTVGICRKVRAYCRAPSKEVGDKPQFHFNLVFE